MREIKFRGRFLFRDRMDGYVEWLYGSLLKDKTGSMYIFPIEHTVVMHSDVMIDDENDCPNTGPYMPAVVPETVGEYIGRKDLHFNDIYEGDIVRDHSDPMGNGDVGVVVYDADRAMFAIRYYGGTEECITYGMYDCKQKELEVIGNIHDNPELLEQ